MPRIPHDRDARYRRVVGKFWLVAGTHAFFSSRNVTIARGSASINLR